MVFQNRHGRRWFYTVARFGLCTNLVAGTPKDGRGISQKQVLEQNLSSTDVHGRTSVERYRDVRFLTVYFKRLTERLNTASEKSSTYQSGQGCPWFRAVATFLHSKNSRSKIDKEINFWTCHGWGMDNQIKAAAFTLLIIHYQLRIFNYYFTLHFSIFALILFLCWVSEPDHYSIDYLP